MESLFYIQIQGRHAAGFELSNGNAQNFRATLESIADGPIVVISSSHRTDIIYTAKVDLKQQVFKLWSLYCGMEITQEEHKKFFFFEGLNDTLTHFFSSLVFLNNVEDWYEDYLHEFRSVCGQEANNPILKELVACEKFIQDKKNTLKRPEVKPLPNIKSSNEVLANLVKIAESSSLN